MKTILLLGAAVLLPLLGRAQADPAEKERQELSRQLSQLLRDPAQPNQEVRLDLEGCHVQQLIRDQKADVKTSRPVSVSVSKGSSDWAVNVADGKFEMRLGFEWRDVTAITYEPERNDEGQRVFELRIQRRTRSSTTTSELTLHTTDEAQVKDLMRRLEKLRQSCR
ncbi:hypothetical protein [Hymenobacter weizhouensis]|uniref:hypothetical protein n=1 Tax=Hymenobacter sp. YIM 151500-1 TaxID=2987689 RepID=UPI00222758D6|nr:hypothetical protein [Hymenobacter sp. YIM 151500-1]UYZ62642.1 hypothetical protein OIS53_16770 [Hymenobacter sp. YIM 151500-1]